MLVSVACASLGVCLESLLLFVLVCLRKSHTLNVLYGPGSYLQHDLQKKPVVQAAHAPSHVFLPKCRHPGSGLTPLGMGTVPPFFFLGEGGGVSGSAQVKTSPMKLLNCNADTVTDG